MGYLLVGRTLELSGNGSLPVSDRGRLVLLGMALSAHDKGNPPDTPEACYWGGWEHLATVWLGYPKYDDKAKRAVARAIAELIDAGLIVVIGRWGGHRGPTMYRLNIWLVEGATP